MLFMTNMLGGILDCISLVYASDRDWEFNGSIFDRILFRKLCVASIDRIVRKAKL